MQEDYNNQLYKLGLDILKKGIGSYTYKLRAEILIPIFLSQELNFGECIQIDCATNVGSLANNLFKTTPSFEEISICDLGCPPRTKTLPVAQIDCNLLKQDDFYNVITNNVILTGKSKCCQKNCPGYETTTLSKIGE